MFLKLFSIEGIYRDQIVDSKDDSQNKCNNYNYNINNFYGNEILFFYSNLFNNVRTSYTTKEEIKEILS